ncbi:MAG: transcription elongation factor GreA [Chloroflexi bacterium]|nr:transcription elongation factor GreA [Chloroflexota bacterium]
MSSQDENYLTPEGASRLKAELKELKGPKREELSRKLREAIQMGDLSENADYIKSKEDQGFLEGRIQELENLLSNVVLIEDDGSVHDKVSLGSWVTIQEGSEPSERYYIVGQTEANPREGRISNESPIGEALMDRKQGDVVTVEAPNGSFKLKILKIE